MPSPDRLFELRHVERGSVPEHIWWSITVECSSSSSNKLANVTDVFMPKRLNSLPVRQELGTQPSLVPSNNSDVDPLVSKRVGNVLNNGVAGNHCSSPVVRAGFG